MQQFYKNERFKCTGDDDWPPYQPDHFTSVALIHHKEKCITSNEVIAVATKTYQGKVGVEVSHDYSLTSTRYCLNSKCHKLANEYFKSCQPTTDITKIFKEISSQNSQTHNGFILIEGAPGIGKTILSKEIAYQWANNNLLSDKTLLFLIFLRDPEIKNITSLEDFIAYALCSKESEKVQRIRKYLEDTSGFHVTIVFDGYDEISDEIRYNSFIAKIINRRTLKLCRLVITSRPTASSVLHGVCDCRIEILGFTEENRMEYIKQNLKGDDDEFIQVKEYLEKNSFINSLCYIPLNMAILICLFKNILKNANCMLPNNQTEMNEQFVCITISRYFMRKGVTVTAESLEKLPKHYKQHLRNLSKLAFDLLGKNQIVFDNDDIKHYANCCDFGLLKTVKFNHQMHASYNFLHFSLQEFLAAYHVRSLFTWNQIKILRECFENGSYYNMWIMYAGLTKGASFAFRHFLTGRRFIFHSIFFKANDIANETISDKIKCLHLFQCFLEAGDDKLCQQVGKYLMAENIDLSNTTLLPKDMHTLCFFLIRSTVAQWKLLDLSNCYIGDDGCKTLVNLLLSDGKSKVKITKMNLSNNQLTSGCIPTILKLVQYFHVNELTVIDNNFDSEMLFEAFLIAFIQQQLLHEMLLSIKMNMRQLFFVVNCMDVFNSQVKFCFQMNNIDLCFWNANFKMIDLLELLPKDITHSKIQLCICKEDSNEHISKIQSEISDLKNDNKYIFLQVSYILISQIQMLAYNMKDYHIIQTMEFRFKQSILNLCLSSCVLPTESLCTIANILSIHYTELEILDISGCNIGDIQFENFYRVLFPKKSVFKQLRELNLSNNSLSTGHIIHLLQLFSINKLVLSNNKIAMENFNTVFFNNKHDVYCNFHSKVPLIVVNNSSINNEPTKNQDTTDLEHLHYTSVYFSSTPRSKDLFNIEAIDDYYVWIFLINTNVTMDCFNIVKRLLSTNNVKKITILEEDETNDVNDNMITQLKAFQALKYNENRDTVINYCLFNANNTNTNVKLKMLNINILGGFINLSFLSPSFLPINSFSCKYWELIDLSNCNAGDNVCTMLLDFFASSVYSNTADVLNLSNTNLSSHSTDNIAKLIVYSRLHTIFVSHNDIKEKDIADAVCKLQSESNRAAMPVIRIFKEHHVALVIHNLIIYSMHRLINYKLYDVTYLSLTNCYLSDEEYTRVDLLSFTKLDLSKSILQELKIEYDVDLEGKKEVTHCVIRNSNITDKAAVLLASKVGRNNTLTHLELTHCSLQQAGLFNVVSALEETSLLQDLSLKSSVITNPVADKIANIIVKNSHLNSLNLSECNLQEGGLSNILKALNKSSLLKIINFSCINYHHSVNHSKDHQKSLDFQSSTCLFSLLPSVISSNRFVEHVDISNCNITENDLANIMENISLLESIKHLDVSGNVVTDVVAVYVAQAIRSNKDMEFLNVSECCLSEHGLFTIFNALSDLSNLLHLDISLNRMFSTAAKKIINVLLLNRKLAHLHLHQCNLSSNDFIQIMSSVGENKFITHLDISHNHINQHTALIITTTILNNPVFKYLDISFCKLTDDVIKIFANCFQKVLNLQHLNISHNNMSHSSAVSMALAIANNESLEYLDLSECDLVDLRVVLLSLQQFSKVKCLIIKSSNFFEGEMFLQASDPPEVASNSCMEYLDLTHCELSGSQMTTIARQLLQVSAMKYINISYNTLSDCAVIDIASVISKNLFFENINLSGCELSESQMISIVKALNSLSRLKHLDISQNKVTNEAANKLASVLANNPSLEHLNLSNCELSELRTTGIFKSLSKTKSFLMFLDISHNTITNNKSDKIASVVVSNPLLEHLNFGNCELSELQLISIFKALNKTLLLTFLDISHNKVTRKVADEIAPVIVNNQSLKYLNVSTCDLLEDFVILIVDSLSYATSLVSLDVSCNYRIQEYGTQHILMSLGNYTYLKNLDLQSCYFNDISALELLPKVITQNKSLQYLKLTDCNLQGKALIAIAKALQAITTVKHLSLNSNHITNEASQELALAVNNNSKLQFLALSDCGLQEAGLVNIAEALCKISSLKHLDLSHNSITDKAATKIASAIANNHTVKYLDFGFCTWQEIGMKFICQAINKLPNIKKLIN